jgi:hypothetical protein
LLTALAGGGAGVLLAVLGWWLKVEPGEVGYWALAGAGTGSLIGAKLWTVAVK